MSKKIKVIEKEFDSSLLNLYEDIKNKVKDKHKGLVIVNNTFLIFQKLFENKNKKGTYVECGVFMGGTLIPAVTFTEETEIEVDEMGNQTQEAMHSLKVSHKKSNGELKMEAVPPEEFIVDRNVLIYIPMD